MKRWALFSIVGMASASAACASILGIQDGILDSTLGSDGGEAGVVICESDSGVAVDTSQVFVSATAGSDESGCGTDQSPCKSIGAGIAALANTRGATLIYVSDGMYNESVHVPKGIEIQGGWHTRGTNPSRQWVQVCADALTDTTQIANIVGVDNVTVHAEDIQGIATLTNLFIASRAADAGESVYGVFASQSTTLLLNHVIVQTENGGEGAPGTKGGDGGNGSGTCPASDGGAGLPGTPGDNASATVFGPTGSLPGMATDGDQGNSGQNGDPGHDGGCLPCVSCPTAAIGPTCGAANGMSCGTSGKSGCGGAAGSPGSAGQSGGSTIGIFAWGGAIVINGGKIQSGKGGNGGSGGSGGPGGIGSAGEIGAPGAACILACSTALGACVGASAEDAGSAGVAGGSGGPGGPGGLGGCGAGGDSFAIYSGIDASVIVDGGATLQAGGAGMGGGNGAPSGTSQVRFP